MKAPAAVGVIVDPETLLPLLQVNDSVPDTNRVPLSVIVSFEPEANPAPVECDRYGACVNPEFRTNRQAPWGDRVSGRVGLSCRVGGHDRVRARRRTEGNREGAATERTGGHNRNGRTGTMIRLYRRPQIRRVAPRK